MQAPREPPPITISEKPMNLPPLTTLGHLSVEEFLRDYWQKKPVLIRQAIPDYQSPIAPDELAGLSLEEDIESRIIVEHGETPWELKKGPFAEDTYAKLPESHWTLLIQAADHYLPEVTALLDRFRFIPNWRLDDIMISYATKGGSVGPHYDQYDVFLLQAGGQRHWQLGQVCDHQTPTLNETQLHTIRDFETQEEYTLNPGDMLYLPPQYAHWGKALDDECITYSIGFRAPSKSEILEELLQECLMDLSEDDRFTDPDIATQDNCGEITPAALKQVHDIWHKTLTDERIREWFGRYMTQPKYEQADCDPIDVNDIDWSEDNEFERNPTSRFAYTALSDQSCDLFVDGEILKTSETLAKLICKDTAFTGAELSSACRHDEDSTTVKLLIAGDKLEFSE